MHPVPIYFHPLSMNARARIRQPIKNVTYVNEWLFVLFTIQVISNINKIIYFSAVIFLRDGDLTERDAVRLGGAVRYGVRFKLDGTGRSAVQVFLRGTVPVP